MGNVNVLTRVLEGDRLECVVTPEHGDELRLFGKTSDIEPERAGASPLGAYPAIVDNAWAFAKYTYLAVNLPTIAEQKAAAKSAKAHRRTTEWLVGLADEPVSVVRHGWCSSCFAQGEHQKVKLSAGHLPAYLCRNCGTPTLVCAAKDCSHMAVRSKGPVRLPRFCAEHRHDIAGFEKASVHVDTLDRYKELFEYEQPNLSRVSKVVGAGATVLAAVATAGTITAPAVGGAIGTAVSSLSFTAATPLYGAAATSYGLALIGGPSGMAGGTIVVAAVGGAVGGVMGSSVVNAYLREDDSFHIEQLRHGPGTPVIVCNGFLSEAGEGWAEWFDIVTKRYPDSPVYRVQWGAKELRNLGALASFSALKTLSVSQVKKAAAAATKVGAKKLGPIGAATIVAGVAKNPWHVAVHRAEKTGVIVADLIARTKQDSYVLVGHSLGARAMAVAAQTMGTDPKDRAVNALHSSSAARIEAVHLLGAAIDREIDETALTARVDDCVYNYHSENDDVLKYLYTAAQGGKQAAGRRGFTSESRRLKNIDVSGDVGGHSEYHGAVDLI